MNNSLKRSQKTLSMGLKCNVTPSLVGSSHLCHIRVHSCRIFNHFDSRKNFKRSVQSFPRFHLLGFGSRLTHAWTRSLPDFTVKTNGFKGNIWTWSSEKSLACFLFFCDDFRETSWSYKTLFVRFIPLRTRAAVHLSHFKPPDLAIRTLRQEARLHKTQIKVQTY